MKPTLPLYKLLLVDPSPRIQYDELADRDTLFVQVNHTWIPADDACDILRSKLIPRLTLAVYQNKITLEQANAQLKDLELQYPSNYPFTTPSCLPSHLFD